MKCNVDCFSYQTFVNSEWKLNPTTVELVMISHPSDGGEVAF